MKLYYKHHGKSFQDDWERVSRLYSASMLSTTFEAPKPVSLQAEKQTIVYEHLPEGQLLAYYFFRVLIQPWRTSAFNDLEKVFYKIGCSLAQFHRYYESPYSKTVRLDFSAIDGLSGSIINQIEKVLDNAPIVGFHGDFGTGNVWLRGSDCMPIILDPIPSLFCPDSHGGKSSIYYDVGHMVSVLSCVYPLWVVPFIKWNRINLAISMFIHGYEEESKLVLDRSALYGVALWLTDAYLKSMRQSIRNNIRSRFIVSRRGYLIEEILS
ncbi:MAG: hypothetical protein JKY90_07020 [Gammaproteobacteria bacterium]|nr:hypothetical protein [Gammaproteobacteria bacterium]